MHPHARPKYHSCTVVYINPIKRKLNFMFFCVAILTYLLAWLPLIGYIWVCAYEFWVNSGSACDCGLVDRTGRCVACAFLRFGGLDQFYPHRSKCYTRQFEVPTAKPPRKCSALSDHLTDCVAILHGVGGIPSFHGVVALALALLRRYCGNPAVALPAIDESMGASPWH